MNKIFLMGIATLALGCGGSTSTDAGTPPADTGTPPADTGTPPADTGTPGFMALNGCAAADYEDRSAAAGARVIANVGSTAYTPRCMTITVGQSVAFMTAFGVHPLSPGTRGMPTAGSPSNPIPSQTSGVVAMVTFPSAGFFPYFCVAHAGMVGVVQVR